MQHVCLLRERPVYDLRVPVSRRQSEYGGVVFGGWARMAQTIASFSIVEVAKPNIGENWPARVRADVTLNLKVRDNIKSKWEGKDDSASTIKNKKNA